MVKPRIRTKKRLNFPPSWLRPDSVDRPGFLLDLYSYVYLAKKQNQTVMLKIRIRLTPRRKPHRPDGLISMIRATPPATTANAIPAAKEINQAGK
jgi:hypothetical protein